MLVSADARVEPRLDIRADARPALGYSDSGLFGSSVLWSLLSTWCGAEVCVLGWAYVVATVVWRASKQQKNKVVTAARPGSPSVLRSPVPQASHPEPEIPSQRS